MTGSRSDITGDSANPSGKRIEKRVWIKASAEVVYRALTNSKELSRWFCDRADCNPCEGGEFIAFWKTGKGGQKGRAIFTSVVPNRLLELLWMEDSCDVQTDSSKHTLSYTIKSKSGMTEVVMMDSDDAAPDEETYAFLDRGWNTVLLELKDFCERRERSVRLRSESKFHLSKHSSKRSEDPDTP